MAIDESLLVASIDLQQYLVDKTTGEALAAGVVTCYQDNSRNLLKNWYYQSGVPGSYTYTPLSNPLTLSAAGTIQDPSGNDVVPLYYPYDEDDSSIPQPYFITVYSAGATLQLSRENWPYIKRTPSDTTVEKTDNYILNNRFWRHKGDQNGNIVLSTETNLVVCPSQHDGFRYPDIRFIKDSTAATESVTFEEFALGEDPFQDNDVPGQYYLRHQCTAPAGNETVKYYQFPVTLHLSTLQNIPAQFSFQLKNNSGNANNQVEVYLLKDTGSGGTGSNTYLLDTFTASNSWEKKHTSFTFANPEGDTITTPDDAYYIQIRLQTNKSLDISFALPSVYLSENLPTNDFQTFDQIDPIINGWRTGDIRQSFNYELPGWVSCNDGFIGKNGTAATGLRPSRANNDTWKLYELLWTNLSDLWAPIYNSSGVQQTRSGSTALADFYTNGYVMVLPLGLGKVLMGANPTFGTSVSFTVSLSTTTISSVDTGADTITLNSLGQLTNGSPVRFTTTGTLPAPIVAGTTYYIRITTGTTVQLFNNQQNAIDNVLAIDITTGGSGTHTVTNTDPRLTLGAATNISPGTAVQLQVSAGGSLPTGLSTSTIYYVSSKSNSAPATTTITLNSDYDNALAGYDLNFWAAGSGTFTLVSALGAGVGESSHTLTVNELANHRHAFSSDDNFYRDTGTPGIANGPGDSVEFAKVTGNTDYTGGSDAHNILQPSVFANVFLKL